MRAVTAAQPAQWRRGGGVGRFVLCLIPLVVLFLVCSAAYNRWAFLHYRSVFPRPGKVYPVDGFGMHLYCTGSGIPTVILESGLGDGARIWGEVQPELSKLTRVCSYDRAGLGWSDPRPDRRDSDSIADQLHHLLATAGISGPMILMGHSIAGLHMRAYLSKYRDGITGAVFVDAVTPDYIPLIRDDYARFVRRLVWISPLMALGLGRLAGPATASRLSSHTNIEKISFPPTPYSSAFYKASPRRVNPPSTMPVCHHRIKGGGHSQNSQK